MLKLSIHLNASEVDAIAASLNGRERPDTDEARTKALQLLVNQAAILHGVVTPEITAAVHRDYAAWSRPITHRLPKSKRTAGPGRTA